MENTFTPNDLIRFIYRETSAEEDCSIKLWIQENEDAALLFQQYVEATQLLEVEEMKPSESSIRIILDFSKEITHQESHA